MATICRIPVELNGTGVTGGGVSTFYTSNLAPATFLAGIRQYYFSLAGLFPDDVGFSFPGDGDLIDDGTGALAGTWTTTAPAVVTGTQTGTWARGVGARAVWNTAGITRGRRVRGTTFLVPMAANQYTSNGILDAGAASSIALAGAALITAGGGDMVIWSRPLPGVGSGGASHAVTSASAPTATSWLRSRRT